MGNPETWTGGCQPSSQETGWWWRGRDVQGCFGHTRGVVQERHLLPPMNGFNAFQSPLLWWAPLVRSDLKILMGPQFCIYCWTLISLVPLDLLIFPLIVTLLTTSMTGHILQGSSLLVSPTGFLPGLPGILQICLCLIQNLLQFFTSSCRSASSAPTI